MKNLDQVATVYNPKSHVFYEAEVVKLDVECIKLLLEQKENPFSIIILDHEFDELLEKIIIRN